MAKINLAQQLATTLEQAGIKRIWGLTGDSLNGLTDALRTMDSIEWMHVRHEEVAAFAAGAEAAATGELTVCAGSCGPGNLHLINGLFDCHRNHVPVLAIAAQILLRDRLELLSGNPPAGTVQRVQPLYRAGHQPCADAPSAAPRHAFSDPQPRRGGGGDPRRYLAAGSRRQTQALAGSCTHRALCRRNKTCSASARSCTAARKSPCCAAAAAPALTTRW